jgi:hypothetical protein
LTGCCIGASLERAPRRWLFEGRLGQPYTKGGFGAFSTRTLQRLFGRPLTVTLLRHLVISALDFRTIDIAHAEQVASFMGHSLVQQQLYRRETTKLLPQPGGTAAPAAAAGGGSQVRRRCSGGFIGAMGSHCCVARACC